MASMAYTYLLDIEVAELWLGHLGKGGAHWEPNTPAFRLGAISPESSYTDQGLVKPTFGLPVNVPFPPQEILRIRSRKPTATWYVSLSLGSKRRQAEFMQ